MTRLFWTIENQRFNGVGALSVQLWLVFSKSKSHLLLLNLCLQHRICGSHELKSVGDKLTKQYSFVVSTERESYHKNKIGLRISSIFKQHYVPHFFFFYNFYFLNNNFYFLQSIYYYYFYYI